MKKILIILTLLASFVQAKVDVDSARYMHYRHLIDSSGVYSYDSSYKKQIVHWLNILKESFEEDKSLYGPISYVVEKEAGRVMIRSFLIKYDTTSLVVNVCTSDTYLYNINPTMLIFGMPTKSIIITSPPEIYNIVDREFIWDFLVKIQRKCFIFDEIEKKYIEK